MFFNTLEQELNQFENINTIKYNTDAITTAIAINKNINSIKISPLSNN